MRNSFFTISLDFELFWGVFPTSSIASYGANILGGREAIPQILSLFKNYNIHATWATVAMASFKNKKELMSYMPCTKPVYIDRHMDAYDHLDNVGENERDDPYHFGYSLLRKITDVAGMEVGSHTFSHFFSLEQNNKAAFRADLEASNQSFRRLGIDTQSLIFCRNEYKQSDLQALRDAGFTSYRGNETSNINNKEHYLFKSRHKQPLQVKAGRWADTCINICGDQLLEPKKDRLGLVDIPSSRMLRPFYNVNYVDHLRLKRIKSSMLAAAQQKKGYHLWWHPHNFGQNLRENLELLNNILEHYRALNDKYGMETLNMSEVSDRIIR